MAVKRNRPRSGIRRKAATAADVIGAASRPIEKVPPKWKKYFDRLAWTLNYLSNRKSDLARDAAAEMPTFSLHIADAGTDSFDRDFALSRVSSEQDALYEINEALNRIREGTYGVCELTGKPIERERLEAIPWTRFSAAAEKQLEKDGSIRRARLGPRRAFNQRAESESAEKEAAEEE